MSMHAPVGTGGTEPNSTDLRCSDIMMEPAAMALKPAKRFKKKENVCKKHIAGRIRKESGQTKNTRF